MLGHSRNGGMKSQQCIDITSYVEHFSPQNK